MLLLTQPPLNITTFLIFLNSRLSRTLVGPSGVGLGLKLGTVGNRHMDRFASLSVCVAEPLPRCCRCRLSPFVLVLRCGRSVGRSVLLHKGSRAGSSPSLEPNIGVADGNLAARPPPPQTTTTSAYTPPTKSPGSLSGYYLRNGNNYRKIIKLN